LTIARYGVSGLARLLLMIDRRFRPIGTGVFKSFERMSQIER
jgi:hypothetical protein